MSSRNRAKIWGILLTVSLALFLGSPLARADNVALGTDYLVTQATTFDTIPGLGLVTFKGVPITGSAPADTIIERTTDIAIGTSLTLPTTPNLLLTGLSMMSTNLPTAVWISLDPANLARDTGFMAITGTAAAGGLFGAALNVFFDICTAPSPTGVGCGAGTSLGTGNLFLSDPATGTPWSPNTPNGATAAQPDGLFLNFALDCDSPTCTTAQNAADQAANQHTGLSPGEVDFWPGEVGPGGMGGQPGQIVGILSCAPGACHPVDPAPASMPEPTSVLLLGTCLLGLAGLARKKLLKSS